MLELQARQGKTVRVENDAIKIIKKGVFGGVREKTLPMRNISSVEVKKPGLAAGFIQFSVAGGVARDSSFTLTGGAMEAAKDENSALFNDKANYEIALKIKTAVEEFHREQTAPQIKSASPADEVRKLKSLLDEGILTQDEFDRKKKQLLGL